MTPEERDSLRFPPAPAGVFLSSRSGEQRIALVEVADWPLVAGRKWFFDGMYAATKDGALNLRMHRLLMGDVPKGLEVDHINRDKLDNRRSNLRLVTHAENCRNVPSQGGSSQYRGVTWSKKKRRWVAQAHLNSKGIFLGHFDDESEAGAAVVEFWRSVEQDA